MTVLYLNPTGVLGGAERSLLQLLAALRRSQPSWRLVLLAGGDGPLIVKARELGVDVVVLALARPLARLGDAGAGGPAGDQLSRLAVAARLVGLVPMVATYALRLRARIREIGPDLVHTNGFKMHALGALCVGRKLPVIWHVRDYVASRPIMARVLRAMSSRCAAAVTNSMSVAQDLRAALGPGLGISTVYNAVDTSRFCPAGPALDLDEAAGMPPAPAGTLRVGLVATMARWKGHEVFLRALSMVAGRLSVRGYVVGGPIYETAASQYTLEELRRLAADLGIAARVGFTGFVEDTAAAMRALDIVVHASTSREPFGLVIAEAMGCGKPVLVAAAGGAAEIIADGENALAYAPGDVQALSAGIARLAADAELRRRLGWRARETAERRFKPERLAQELCSLYERTVARAA